MRLLFVAMIASAVLGAQTSNPEALFRQGVDAQQRGDFASAVAAYRKLLKLQPKRVEVLNNLGAALAHLNRFDEAIATDRAALALDPSNPGLRLNLALAYYKKGDLKSAATEFEQLHASSPSDGRVLILLADCYARSGNPAKAVQLLQPLEAAQPGNPDVEFVLGLALINDGKRRAGAELVDKAAEKNNAPDAYLLAGSTWLDLNEYARAKRDLDRAEELNPHLPHIHALAGVVRDKSGDSEGAIPEFEKALAADPNDFEANLNLGAIYYKARDMDKAKRYVNKAVELNPKSTLARFELGLVQSASGENEAALSNLQEVTAQAPEWLEPHVRLAALYFKLHRPQDGAKERAIVDKLEAQTPQTR